MRTIGSFIPILSSLLMGCVSTLSPLSLSELELQAYRERALAALASDTIPTVRGLNVNEDRPILYDFKDLSEQRIAVLIPVTDDFANPLPFKAPAMYNFVVVEFDCNSGQVRRVSPVKIKR